MCSKPGEIFRGVCFDYAWGLHKYTQKFMAEKIQGWLLAVIVGIVVIAAFQMHWFGLGLASTGEQTQTGPSYISTGATTLTVVGSDSLSPGTSVTGTSQVSVNGGLFAAGTFSISASPNDVLDVLVINGTTYHNAVVSAAKTPQAPTGRINVALAKNASVTENIYTTTGLVIASGTQNQTDLGNGASYNLKDEMTAAALTSTNDMVCIIEITAGNNASTTPAGATLNGQNAISTSKPIWYTTAGINSNVYSFNVPAISSSATQTFTVGLNAKSTGRFSAGSQMIKTCYTKENFVDPNTGKLVYDVADSNGLVKSMAAYSKTVTFQ